MTRQLLPFYSFDSGAIINGRRDIFLPNTFSDLWAQIEKMIASGQVRAVDEVKREVLRKDDEAAGWARAQSGLFVPLTLEVQEATRAVLAAFPKLVGIGGGTRNGADSFVIGLAMVQAGAVVTQESRRGSLKKPKIPDVCEEMGVPWMTLPQFVDEQGWSVSIV